MKKIVILTCSLIFALLCFGQNIIYLKTGDKLNGKVLGGKKDSIYFNFLGNKLRFANSDIKAIFFSQEALDELTTPPAPPAPVVVEKPKTAKATKTAEVIVDDPNAATEEAQTATPAETEAAPTPKTKVNSKQVKIGGTINYYLTKDNISKADSGAQVFIVDSAKVPTFKIAVVDTFHFGNAYREIYQQYKLTHTKVPDDITEQLKLWNADDKNNFDLLSRRVYKNINLLKNSLEKETAIADFRGQFSIPVKAGTYYVYIISNFAKGQTPVDMDGKIYCRKIIVKGDIDELFKVSFDVF